MLYEDDILTKTVWLSLHDPVPARSGVLQVQTYYLKLQVYGCNLTTKKINFLLFWLHHTVSLPFFFLLVQTIEPVKTSNVYSTLIAYNAAKLTFWICFSHAQCRVQIQMYARQPQNFSSMETLFYSTFITMSSEYPSR